MNEESILEIPQNVLRDSGSEMHQNNCMNNLHEESVKDSINTLREELSSLDVENYLCKISSSHNMDNLCEASHSNNMDNLNEESSLYDNVDNLCEESLSHNADNLCEDSSSLSVNNLYERSSSPNMDNYNLCESTESCGASDCMLEAHQDELFSLNDENFERTKSCDDFNSSPSGTVVNLNSNPNIYSSQDTLEDLDYKEPKSQKMACKMLVKSRSMESAPVLAKIENEVNDLNRNQKKVKVTQLKHSKTFSARLSDPGTEVINTNQTGADIGKPPLKYATASLGRRRTLTWSGIRNPDKDWKSAVRSRLSVGKALSLTPSSSPGREGVTKQRRRKMGVAILSKMSEGRMTHVTLLDERILEITVQPKLTGEELRDLVASHCSLKEKEFFSFTYLDDTGQKQWLLLDRRVLEQDINKKISSPSPLQLRFQIRLFISSISRLNENVTIELFYLQAKQLLLENQLECDTDSAFELAAYVLQASQGNYIDESTSRSYIKKLCLLPTSVLKEFPSISYCEDEIIKHHRRLTGQSRGTIIVNYMSIVESLPTYGVHFYEVKDKNGLPWWLGVSFRGISLYDIGDRKTPRKSVFTLINRLEGRSKLMKSKKTLKINQVYFWKSLENLFFRDRKFSIEVIETSRGSGSLGRSGSSSTLNPGSKVSVHSWTVSSNQIAKNIWNMAVGQHQFYLDCKHCKLPLAHTRCLADIATDLNHSTRSLAESCSSSSTGGGNPSPFVNSTPSLATQHSVEPCGHHPDPIEGMMIRSSSAHCLRTGPSFPPSLTSPINYEDLKKDLLGGPGGKAAEAQKEAQLQMHRALKAHRDALQARLDEKLQLLKELCLKESELTGVMPPEYPVMAGEQTPQVRKRIGTAFTLSPQLLDKNKDKEELSDSSKIEMELEVQAQILAAALRLAKDKSLPRIVRRNHKETYRRASEKVSELKVRLSRCQSEDTRTFRVDTAVDDLSEDSCEFLDEDPEFDSPIRRRRSGTVGEERGGGIDDNFLLKQINKRQQQLPRRPNTVATARPQLQHCTSVPQKMEYESYDRVPSSIRTSASSSTSLGSLMDQTPSPGPSTGPSFRDQDVSSPGIKIYKKVGRSNPKRSHKSSTGLLSKSNSQVSSMYGSTSSQEEPRGFVIHAAYNDGTSTPSPAEQHRNVRYQPLYTGHKTESYTGSNRSTPSQRSLENARSASRVGDAYSVTSGERFDETDKDTSEQTENDYKAYLERTQTWPANPRRSITPADIGPRVPLPPDDLDLSCQIPNGTASNEMLADLSPSKFGSKRESKSDAADSPYRFVEGSRLMNGDDKGGRVEGRRARRQRSETPGRTVASKNLTHIEFSDDLSADYKGSLTNLRLDDDYGHSSKDLNESPNQGTKIQHGGEEQRWRNQEVVAANYVEQSKPLETSDVLKYSRKYKDAEKQGTPCNRKLDYAHTNGYSSHNNVPHEENLHDITMNGDVNHIPNNYESLNSHGQWMQQFENDRGESFSNSDYVAPAMCHMNSNGVLPGQGRRRSRPLVKREGAMLERNHAAVDALFKHNEDNVGTLPMSAHFAQNSTFGLVRGISPLTSIPSPSHSDSNSLPYSDDFMPSPEMETRHFQPSYPGSKAHNKSFHPMDNGGGYNSSVGHSPLVFQKVPHHMVDSGKIYPGFDSSSKSSSNLRTSDSSRALIGQIPAGMTHNQGSTSTLASSSSSGLDWYPPPPSSHDQPDMDSISTLV